MITVITSKAMKLYEELYQYDPYHIRGSYDSSKNLIQIPVLDPGTSQIYLVEISGVELLAGHPKTSDCC